MVLKQLPRWLWKNLKKSQTIVLFLFGACLILIKIQRIFQFLDDSGTKHAKVACRPDFSLHLPFVEPTLSVIRDRNLYLAVVVNSAATGEKYRNLRNVIRRTWGNSSLNYGKKTWKIFFVLGISENNTEHEMNLQEALLNNDVMIGNFTDCYKSLILKTFMSHYWVTSKFPFCKYVLKTDDDVYVRVPKLLQWLEEAGSPLSFYGGYVGLDQRTVRDPKSKWFLTKEQYEEKYWPPFCHGAFHVLSTDILPKYFNYTKFRRKPFHTDDAYLGVVARDLGIKAVQIPGFNLQFRIKPRSYCDLTSSIAMGHKITASKMIGYYEFFTKKAKTTVFSCLALHLQPLSRAIFFLSLFVGEFLRILSLY